MSTRGILKAGKKTFGIWHDAYPSGFGQDLKRFEKGRIKFSTLQEKYDLSLNETPPTVFIEHRYSTRKRIK